MAGSMRVVFPGSTRRGKVRAPLRKKPAFIRNVMTGRDAKTPIRDRNYMQVQRDDYTASDDRLYRCREKWGWISSY